MIKPEQQQITDKAADNGLSARQFVVGAGCAIAAVAIWAGWLVMMKIGVATTLSAADLTALRFAVAGPLLLPILLRRGFAIDRLGWLGLVAIVTGVLTAVISLALYGRAIRLLGASNAAAFVALGRAVARFRYEIETRCKRGAGSPRSPDEQREIRGRHAASQTRRWGLSASPLAIFDEIERQSRLDDTTLQFYLFYFAAAG
jgi:EamA-like transporter family